MMDIKDKVTIVTGASAGIGRAVALRLSSAGARLALAARSVDKLRLLTDNLKGGSGEALMVPTDMRDRAEVEHLVAETLKRFGRIDILINNAGQGMAGVVENADMGDYLKLIELNVFGPVYAMQAVIPPMRQAGGGMIVNISSMVSKMHIPGLGFYASTKAALNILSETARDELHKDNIRVLTVFPRTTATDFGPNSLGDRQLRQRQRSAASASIPADSADYVAGKILKAIERETAEQYMAD
jgi:short-subunit dehydrogenase